MDTAAQPEEVFLPKEPLDLPKPELDLPLPEKELPSSTSHHTNPSAKPHEENTHHDIKTLLAWQAPSRPFQKHSLQYFTTSLLITFMVEIILFLFSQYALMFLVLSLTFVALVLSAVPPHLIHYRFSSEGITIEDHFFLWQELYDFYFKKRDGTTVLYFRTKAMIPGELTVVLGDMHPDHVKSILLPYLPYREIVRLGFLEKSGNWLSRTFPLEQPRGV